MECQFSFGPDGTYFLKSDSSWAWSDRGLPELLRLILTDRNHPLAVKKPYDVALGYEPGTFSMSWKTMQDQEYLEQDYVGPRCTRLKDFLDIGELTTRTVFGPNASYFSISPSGFSWQHLPDGLEVAIQNRMKKGLPASVALGIQGAYVALFTDGQIYFDLEGQYPEVDTLLRNSEEISRRNGISYVALNPFVAGQHYIVFGNGSASWTLPNEWSEDVRSVSTTIRAVNSKPSGVAGLIQANSNFYRATQVAYAINHKLF